MTSRDDEDKPILSSRELDVLIRATRESTQQFTVLGTGQERLIAIITQLSKAQEAAIKELSMLDPDALRKIKEFVNQVSPDTIKEIKSMLHKVYTILKYGWVPLIGSILLVIGMLLKLFIGG